jgi:hypothetical protein
MTERIASLGLFHRGIAMAWLALAAVPAMPASAQQPPEAAAPAPSAAPANPADQPATPASIEQRLDALTHRVADQDAELARQRAELDAYKANAEAKEADAAVAAVASANSTDATEALVTQPLLRVYGFMDMGLQRNWGGLYDVGVTQTNAPTFVLGNVNLYFDANPTEHWRALAEIRYTTFPNGAETLDPGTVKISRQSTTVNDYTSPNSGFTTVQWGGIILERAHIDYMGSDAFNIRTGYFLTPYGIWNVDHGSPTRIMLREPLFISVGLLPERQTGVDVYGVFHALPWEFGYHAYVSNGRAPAVDFTDDKAVGGRLTASTRRPIPIQFGASLYYGRETDVEKSIGLNDGMLGIERKTIVDYTEVAGGGDVSMDIGALRLRSEFVARRVVFEPGKRPLNAGAPEASTTRWGGYFMAAYRLPWYGLEPLAVAEIIRYPSQLAEGFVYGSAGLNVYLSESTILRTQYIYQHGFDFSDSHIDLTRTYAHILAARLIIAF